MFLLHFFVYSNLLISLVAGALTFGFTTHLESKDSFLYAVVAFGATLFTYNLHRILRLKEIQIDYSSRQLWILRHPTILYALASVGFLLSVSIYVLFFFTLKSALILGIVSVISLGYAWRTKPNQKTLREYPYIKIYLIGISWTLVSFVWPILHEQLNLLDYSSIIIAGFLFIFSATIPFDIRDSRYDSPKQKTIPLLVGEKVSKIIAVVALMLSFAIISNYSTFDITNYFIYIAYLGMFFLIAFTNQNRPELYFSFLIDGWILFFGAGLYWLN